MGSVRQRGPELKGMRDDRLKRWSGWLKMRANRGEPLDKLLPDAFAGVREAARRALGYNAFSCQIMAGLTMHRGRIAEMATGEGKTLAAVFAAYLNGLTGKGVHILTFNDYLAQRDAAWMGAVFEMLDMSTAAVFEGLEPEQRRQAYQADITYLTAQEAGFDYLRDALVLDPEDRVQQRPFHFAIVDEADSILIDEARVPLVIAGQLDQDIPNPRPMAQFVASLNEGDDYHFDEYRRNVFLSESGFARAEKTLGVPLHEEAHAGTLSVLNLALHAATLLHRDKDYIVRDNRVECIDALTGRLVDKRRWPHGLHAALEAKEGVEIQKEGSVLGSLTIQHLAAMYPKLAGMTATAQPSAKELDECYGLHITAIPPNKPCMRKDQPNLVFSHKEARDAALIEEICNVHKTGRPLLIGTASVEESENLARALKKEGITAQVLNARTHDVEAAIIAGAGALGAVTISTNMAGRGADIKLGGEDEGQREKVVALGGLYVIGTNRHESSRIDDQLRGRSGRQGDPGETRFFTSLQDDLITRFNVMSLLPKRFRHLQQDEPLTHPVVLGEVDRAQRIIEGQFFYIRRTLWSYATILEQQRQQAQVLRDTILNGESPFTADLAGDADEKKIRELALLRLDGQWTAHLAGVDALKDGIHLTRYGGQDPLFVFRKRMDEAFDGFLEQVETLIGQDLKLLAEGQFEEVAQGLKRPSSTWTYLANDNPFGNQMGFSLMGSGGIGYAVGSFFLWPFLLGAALVKRLIGKDGH